MFFAKNFINKTTLCAKEITTQNHINKKVIVLQDIKDNFKSFYLEKQLVVIWLETLHEL